MRKQIFLLMAVLMLALQACGFDMVTPLAPLPTLTPFPTSTSVPVTETPVPTITPTPVPVLNSPFGPPLISIHMFTKNQGWGVIENQLLVTSDGGVTWAGVPVPGGKFDGFNGMFFQSESIAYVLVAHEDGRRGTLNYTQDRGQTWESIFVPLAYGRVQFLPGTNLEGFILQDLGVAAGSQAVAVFQTLDRFNWGLSFEHDPDGSSQDNLPLAGIKSGMVFISPSTGWITGSEPVQNLIYVFRSGDAGRTWQPVDLPVPDGIQDFMSESYPPIFVGGPNGYLPVDFMPASGEAVRVFYFTPDAGSTWNLTATLPRGSAAYDFVDVNIGWSWANGRLYYTSDAAATWTAMPVSLPSREDVTQLDFIDPLNGWVITVDDRARVHLYSTADGGGTWAAVIP